MQPFIIIVSTTVPNLSSGLSLISSSKVFFLKGVTILNSLISCSGLSHLPLYSDPQFWYYAEWALLFLFSIKMEFSLLSAHVLLTQWTFVVFWLLVLLFNDLMNGSLLGSSVHEISQVGMGCLEWVAIPFSRRSQPRTWACVFCIAGRFFTTEPLGKPQWTHRHCLFFFLFFKFR